MPFSYRPLRVAVLLSGALVALACAGGRSDGSDSRRPRACTNIGCLDGLAVQLSRPLREPGAYTIVLDIDGERVTCQSALPFAGCAEGPSCSSSQVILEQSGCALPPNAHEIIGLHVRSAPKVATVQIARDGSVIGAQSFTPSYVSSQPNGEGCEPVCEQASVTLVVR